ncbi:TlpA family protein disulfide reductase [Fulvivirga imtechensis]|nr:TlpA disulfide reductase family protein [Fulvivirga imtechensis]
MVRFVFLTLIIAIISCTGGTTTESTESQPLNQKLKLKTLEGDDIDLEEYKGKTIFINFWATWCRPCIIEMPSIEKAQTKLKDKNIVFIMASNEPRGQIKNFMRSHQYDFHYAQLDMSLEQLNIQGLPTTLIINSEGEVVFSEMGARDWNAAENIQLVTQYIE